MKRLITSIIFTLAILVLYQFIDINLFTIDLPRRVRCELFKRLRDAPELDPAITILDIEYIALEEVKLKLQLLESMGATAIGVNLCNMRETSAVLNDYLYQNKQIVTCDCSVNSKKRSSRITSSENEVTHFLTDTNTYFELQLSDKANKLKGRKHDKERINYRAKSMYYELPLSEVENILPEVIKNHIVLVGFLRDSLVTPMNDSYGRTLTDEGDMSDVQISANIISTINRNEFINEVNPILRVSIILLVSLLNTGLLRLLRTSQDALNIMLSVVVFIILNGLSSGLIVLAFSRNYYLNLDEMTVVLLVSAIVSIYWNTKSKIRATQSNTLV